MAEAASLTPLFAGVTYERLEGYKTLQWPVAEDGTDQPLLFTKGFPFPDGKAKLFPLEWQEPSEEITSEFDLHLNNGRLLEHFEQGAMTYRSEGIKEITPNSFLEVSPELAAERGLESGRWVRLKSPTGQIKVQVLVTDRVHGKQLYMPMKHDRGTSQPPHQQPYRCGDAYAGVQGNFRSHDAATGDGREPLASQKLPLRPSHSAKRRRGGAEMEAERLLFARNRQRRQISAN